MPNYDIWALGASNITVTGGNGSLSGFTGGNGSNLNGATITLNNNNWEQLTIRDNNDANFNDSQNGQSLPGNQSFDGQSFPGNPRIEAEYSFTVTDGVNTYTLIAVNINESGSSFPSYGTVEGLAFLGAFPPIGVPLTVTSTTEGPSNPYVDLAEPICFTPGVRIKTPNGLRAIETLKIGDLVETEDGGPQPIRWIGRIVLTADRLRHDPHLAPVRITKGALGDGRPFQTIETSPQHRFVVRSDLAALHFGVDSTFVAAIHLVEGTHIYQRRDAKTVTYMHLLLDDHHVIRAEGCKTESLQLTDRNLSTMSDHARRELLDLFPQIDAVTERHVAARHSLRAWEAGFLSRL